MLRFFRSSRTIVIVVIILLGILTWLHALLQPPMHPDSRYGMFLFRMLDGWLSNLPATAVCCGLLLTLTAAMILIVVNNKLHLIDKISYLPGLCYVLLIGGVPMLHRFNPTIIAAILLVFGFQQLMESFESEKLSYRYLTASILISIAVFFYRYAYIYMLPVWLSVIFLRPGYWREWVFSLFGFLLPVFFIFGWFFIFDGDYMRMPHFFEEMFSMERIIPDLSLSTMAFFGISTVVIAVTFGHLMRYIGSKKIVIRNGYYFIMLIAVVTVILSAAVPDTLPLVWYLAAFPLSFILSNYLATVRSKRWGTGMLAFLFIGVITAQIIYLVQFF